MVVNIKNDFVEFKAYPASSVFVQFKKDEGESVEVAVQNPEKDQVSILCKLVYLAHKAYCRLTDGTPSITEEKIMDALTLNELTDIFQKFMGTEIKGEQKKTK